MADMNNSSIKAFSQFLHYSKKWRPKILLATFYSIINKLFDIAPEILIGFAVDLVVKKQSSFIASMGFVDPKSQLALLGVCTFLIWAFESLFQYMYSITWRNIAQSVEHEIRLDAYQHVQSLDMQWYDKQKIGNISAILNDDVNQLERFLDNGANEIIQIIVSTVSIGAIFFYISPLVAFASILPVPIILLIAMFFQKNLSPRYSAVRDSVGLMNSTIFNNLLGIMTIKSFTAEKVEANRVKKFSNDYREKNNSAILLSSAFIPVVRMGVLSGFLATMIIGGFLALSSSIEVGTFSVLVFLTQRFLWPFTRLGETIDLFARSMASTKRILNLINTPLTISDIDNSIEVKDLKGNILFNDISFGYSDKENVFSNLNLKINDGDFVGIVGKTGIGKTTLIKLLLRFYEPKSGEILIGENNISELKINSLRSHIGLVSQEIFLFDGTVKENMIYPLSDVSDSVLDNVSSLSQAKEFIDNLPMGYDTLIGERGIRLSVGQKQRISIARALIRDPSILIFDEATSSVDNKTEYLIQKALNEISKDRTTLVIAHRLSTIRNADQILVIDDGKLIEYGTHEVLLSENGIYKYLWDLQSGKLDN